MRSNLPAGVKVSACKIWFSYLYPLLLAKTSSSYNPVLEVRLSRGRLRLDSGNSTYSYEDLYDTFYTPFRHLKIAQKTLQTALVLGVGLCSVPLMLYQYFNQRQTRFVAVDIDEVVISLSRQFVLPDVLAHTDFFTADAFDFTAADTRFYDLIAVDVFIDTNTPSKFRSAEFLQLLKNRLNPGGLLLYNTMTGYPDLNKTSNTFYRSTFKQVFPGAFALRTSGNRVLVFQNPTA
ncbi:hypothetical protein C7N43_08850 [Sphingobacteriales bacterium UPWRP_1]|nr:hypothetical protein BVG80_10955 [Sphingobacteriales bacterium TSM_CSM]PSJ77436.1 hypothetical protein C7N43_08850 [Sphingobacteriales bacterium UPWRP_1]